MNIAPVIIVHGGAWSIPDDLVEPHKVGCREAALVGWQVLLDGGSALDAVEAANRVMEDNPTFDAGVGSVLNRDGVVELDAAIMDGRSLEAGAVIGLQTFCNPITLARRVLESGEHVVLMGEGARRFALELGIPECDPASLVVPREREIWEQARQGRYGYVQEFFSQRQDTVGAVAMDRDGDLAAGNSTGGCAFKRPGRVGDVPLIGCGSYADNELGAACSTGHGEAIIRVVMAKHAVSLLEHRFSPQITAEVTIRQMEEKIGGRAGIIMIDRQGRLGAAFNTPHMAHAWMTVELQEPIVRV